MRELLEKGKALVPDYDVPLALFQEDTLLEIYKQCYHTDQIFLNKMTMIAKNRKEAENDQDDGWIQAKQHQKSNNYHQEKALRNENRERFNFLEDKICTVLDMQWYRELRDSTLRNRDKKKKGGGNKPKKNSKTKEETQEMKDLNFNKNSSQRKSLREMKKRRWNSERKIRRNLQRAK